MAEAENYNRRQEIAQQVINSYYDGQAVFDTAFRSAYNAAVYYHGDPEVVDALDQALGGILVQSVQERDDGILLARGETQYSPPSNHEGKVVSDVALWLSDRWDGDKIIRAPLASGCHPVPRRVFAELLMNDYSDGRGSFGPAFRAAYDAVKATHNRVDKRWQMQLARFSLGKVVVACIESGVIEDGKQEIEVCSQQTMSRTWTGKIKMEPDTRLYVDPVKVSWTTDRQAVGEAIYPLDALSPHRNVRNDNLAALRRAKQS